MANMHSFTFICCCVLFLLCVPGKAVNLSSLLEIANYVMEAEEAAGNFDKGYQHLAEAILRRLGPFFPEHRFVVLVSDKESIDFKTGHAEYFFFNMNITVLINIALDSAGSFVGSVDCYGNITAKFENCHPATDKILHHIGEMCSAPGYEISADLLSLWVIRKESDLGAASSFPANTFRDQLFGCPRGKQRWRVVIALNQFYEVAQSELFNNLNFKRIKARANGKFVSAQNGGDDPLAAVRDRVNIWEEFTLIQNPRDGTFSLRVRADGKFVTADLNQAGLLVARSETVQQWEKFQMEPKGGGANGNEGTFTLKARANGKFVAVDSASQVLVADRDTAEDVATIFELSSVLSGQAQGQVMEFPTNDEGSNIIRVPVLLWILSSIGGLFLLLALAFACLFVCLLYKYSGEIRGSFGLQVSAFWLLRVRNRLDRRLDNTAIDNEYLLYSGPNSRVYFARFRWAPDEVREVAVKVPSKEAFRMDMIIEETRINAQLRHPRIVEYIGYYRDAFRDMRIVSEFMAGGDLHTFLGNRKHHLTVGHLFNFMGQIAEGMEYLASWRIIHRDLAARNCMLDRDCTSIKIADFGLSRHFNLDSNYTCTSPVRLPIRWTAIECLGQNAEILPNSKFSEKSDVWSFGIVVWECFTRGEMPYGAKEVREVLGELRGGWRLPRPPNCPPPLFEKLVLSCWEGRPELRPDFTKVRQMIDDIFSQVVIEMPETIADPVD